ncbi:hypothetical protein [Brevibacillus fortis]|uniref:hypothetical protein n=1 Tax=Brevibacillus fortis TaxID=2126352 RepID=UPI0038FC8675
MVIALLFGNATSIFAKTSDEKDAYMQRSEIEQYIDILSEEGTEDSRELSNKLKEYLGDNEDYLFEEIVSIVDEYADKTTQSENNDNNMMDIDQEDLQRDFERIDALAKEYYDYYQIHNEFPEEVEIRSITTSHALTVLEEIGIKITEKQLLKRLAALGVIAAIDGPIPVGDFIALVTGAVITGEFVGDYVANQGALAKEIGEYFGRAFIKVVTKSVTMSEEVEYQIKKKKVKHFAAKLNSDGGIFVEEPLTLRQAQLEATRGKDTFSVSRKDAENVVTQTNYRKVYEDPHFIDGEGRLMIANLPHFHLIKKIDGEWKRVRGHHFFSW